MRDTGFESVLQVFNSSTYRVGNANTHTRSGRDGEVEIRPMSDMNMHDRIVCRAHHPTAEKQIVVQLSSFVRQSASADARITKVALGARAQCYGIGLKRGGFSLRNHLSLKRWCAIQGSNL